MSDKPQRNLCPLQLITSCIKCQNYLTIGPIFTTPNGDICGRCNVDSELIKIRATAYENLAKCVTFPCKNQKFGCNKLLQFNDKLHESMCDFNGFLCPTYTKCTEKVGLRNLEKHYELKHKNLIIFQNFQISQKQLIATNKLMIIDKKPFILQLFTIKNMECSLALCYIENNQQNYKKYCVEALSDNANSFILNQQNIVKFNPKIWSVENCTIINFNTIKQILNSPNFNFKIHLIAEKPPINKALKPKEEQQIKTVKATIAQTSNVTTTKTVEATTTKPPKDEFLEELECIVCKEYMTPPIYVCKTGHSICSECKNRIQQCPTCTATYEGTRNIVLEKLTEHVQYPCHNNVYGCKFIDKLANLRIHEKDCMQITCPLYNLDNCRHKGTIHTIYQHCQHVHPQRLLNLNREIARNIKTTPLSDLYIVQHDGKVFNLSVDHGLCSMVIWSMEQIDLIDDNNLKYKFIIDFIDKTNQGRILRISGLCQNPKQNDPFANASIKLPDYLLKPFVDKNGVLHFRIDIKKIVSC